MKLEHFQLLKEDEGSFHLQHKDGSHVPVTKRGLSKKLVEKIQQHFAEGGEVDSAPDPAADPATDPMAILRGLQSANPQEDAATLYARMKAGERGQVDNTKAVFTGTPVPLKASDQDLQAQIHPPAPAAPAEPAAVPAPPQVAAPQPAAPPPPPPVNISSGPNIAGDIAKSFRGQEAAIGAQAKATAAEATDLGKIQAQQEAQRAAAAQEWQGKQAEWQARGDKLKADIASNQIDPRRLWNNSSTGQKITASIGMILGGIGAGLTHGPNYAVQVIDSAIQRDLEAQRSELGKKENLLGHHMQEGHDLQSAHQLAKADALDAAAAQVQQVATKYAGPKAQAAAAQQIAALSGQAALARQQVAERGMDMQMKSVQVEQAKRSLGVQGNSQQALAKLMTGRPLSPGEEMLIGQTNEKLGERIVRTMDGGTAIARSKEDAEKVRESFARVQTLRDKLARYRQLSSPSTFDRGSAKAIHSDILLEMGHLHDLNRLTEEEMKQFKEQVPDLADLVKPGAAQRLDALGKTIHEKIRATNRNYLIDTPGSSTVPAGLQTY